MENQAKVIVIERNKFASLVKSHRKCLQMLNILTYIYTVKEVSLTLTLQEICEVLHMTPEEVEIQRQKGYIRFTTQKGMTVYEITDLLRLENMLEYSKQSSIARSSLIALRKLSSSRFAASFKIMERWRNW